MKTRMKSPDPFFHKGTEVGVLLIHGFTGSPSEMRPLGNALHKAGYTVYAPLLAGHGSTPEDMAMTTWRDWWQSVQTAYDKLVEEGCSSIYVAGLSMGGILSIKLSVERNVKAVISLCAPIFVQDSRLKYAGLFKHFIKFDPRVGQKPPHIEDEIVPLDRTPVGCYQSLYRLIRSVKKIVPRVTSPILIVQARKDETIQPRSSEYIYAHVSSEIKELKWYENSTHIITVDKERESLFKDVIDFISNIENRVTLELRAENG